MKLVQEFVLPSEVLSGLSPQLMKLYSEKPVREKQMLPNKLEELDWFKPEFFAPKSDLTLAEKLEYQGFSVGFAKPDGWCFLWAVLAVFLGRQDSESCLKELTSFRAHIFGPSAAQSAVGPHVFSSLHAPFLHI
jgi:hypothetical protein